MKKPRALTKPCIGWGQNFKKQPLVKCQAGAQVMNLAKCKRCPACATAQHRLVVNASYRRNWPKYLRRKQIRKLRKRSIVAEARELLLAPGAGA